LSDDKEDLELAALQRELDDAFATTRPRRGFEDELWLRMQARRPLWTRLRDVIGSTGALFRQAPAIPLGAVAVLLVVVVGAGILLNSGLRLGPTHNSYTQGAQAPGLALSDAGKLPTPALHPGLVPALPRTAPACRAASPWISRTCISGRRHFGGRVRCRCSRCKRRSTDTPNPARVWPMNSLPLSAPRATNRCGPEADS